MNDYIRLIISDTHVGSMYSQEEKLINFLKSTYFDELVLAGDIVEFLRNPSFTPFSRELFEYIHNLQDKKIVYIVGNHDVAFHAFVNTTLMNVEFKKEHVFKYYGRIYRVVHGDEYDTGLVKQEYLMQLVSFVQNAFERLFKIDLTTLYANWKLKKRKLIRIWDIISWNKDIDVLIMGHTHVPEVLIWVDKNEKIKTYINSGDWVGNCTYVIIKDGQVRLRKYEE